MDPTTLFCPNCIVLPEATGRGYIGTHSQQDHRCICHVCHKTCSATKGTVLSRLRTSAETVVIVVALLATVCPCSDRGRFRV